MYPLVGSKRTAFHSGDRRLIRPDTLNRACGVALLEARTHAEDEIPCVLSIGSYTTFRYDDLSVEVPQPGTRDDVELRVNVTNKAREPEMKLRKSMCEKAARLISQLAVHVPSLRENLNRRDWMDFHPSGMIRVLHIGSGDSDMLSNRRNLNVRVIAARTGGNRIGLCYVVLANDLECEIAAFRADVTGI